jgi:cell division initiation protein
MKFPPMSIKQQEFSKSVRGYDRDEVQAFLDKLSEEFDALQKENEQLKKELDAANIRLNEFRRIEKNLQDTLLRAQESSTKSLESTRRQSNLMVKEAEIKASQILEKARESANEIRKAVINLREEKDLLVAKLKAIISSQAHLLELKVEHPGDKKAPVNKIEGSKQVEINIEEIVNKIL